MQLSRNAKIALIAISCIIFLGIIIGSSVYLTSKNDSTIIPKCSTKEPVSDLEKVLIGKTITEAINIIKSKIETERLGINPSKIYPTNENKMVTSDYVMGRIRLYYCDAQENFSNDIRIVTKIKLN